jgi:hypothetical protein
MGTVSAVVTLVGRNNTGISVNAGDLLRFNCTGFIDEGDHNLGEIIADGEGRAPDGHLVDDGAADSAYPFPGKTRYALAGGILDASMNLIDRFMIGRFTQFVAPATGQIALFANDDKPGDNHSASGHQTPWVVSIDVTSPAPPPPPNTPGLRIADIQIVQIAQNLQEDCVLVAGKTTAVRAFVTVLDPSYAGRAEVGGTVEVIRVNNGGNMTVVGTFPALNPEGKPNAAVLALAGAPVDSSNTSSSLNFDVPGSFLPVDKEFSHYTFKVSVFIIDKQTGQRFDGPGYMDVDQRSAGFVPGFPLSISLVLVSAPVNGSPPQVPSATSLNVEQTELRLPLSDGSLQVQPAFPPVVTLPFDVGDKGDGYEDVLLRIADMVQRMTLRPANPNDRFLVLVPPNPSPPAGGHVVGLSDGDYVAVVSADPTDAARIAAHELNHTLGLAHAASPGCLTPSGIDATLPIAADAPGWTAIDSLVESVGTPAAMGYCPSPWPTAEEFSRGYRRLAGS